MRIFQFSNNKHGEKIDVVISRKLVLVNMASSVFTQVFSVAVLIWLQPYLLKRISPEEYSLLPVVTSIMGFAPLISALFISGIGRFLVEAYAEGKAEEVTNIFSSIMPVIAIIGLIILVAGTGFSFRIDSFINVSREYRSDAMLMMLLLVGAFVINFWSMPFFAGFAIKQAFVLQNFISCLVELLRLSLLLFLILGLGAHVIWVVVAYFVSMLIGSAAKVFVSKKLVPQLKIKKNQIDFKRIKKIFSFGSWMFVGQIAEQIRKCAQPIMLNWWSTPLDVANFHLGSLFNRQLDNFLPLLLQPLQPVLIALYVKRDITQLKYLFFSVNKYLMWMLSLIMIPLFLFGEKIFMAYVGPNFMLAAHIMALLIISKIIELSLYMIWRIAPAVNQIRRISMLSLIMQVVNIILSFVLIKYYSLGAVGSAIAVCCSIIIGSLFLILPISRDIVRFSVYEWLKNTLIPGCLPAVWTAIIWYAIFYYKHGSAASILLGSLIAIPFYFLICFFCMNNQDKLIISQFIRSNFTNIFKN